MCCIAEIVFDPAGSCCTVVPLVRIFSYPINVNIEIFILEEVIPINRNRKPDRIFTVGIGCHGLAFYVVLVPHCIFIIETNGSCGVGNGCTADQVGELAGDSGVGDKRGCDGNGARLKPLWGGSGVVL